jgi:hypothetical protein
MRLSATLGTAAAAIILPASAAAAQMVPAIPDSVRPDTGFTFDVSALRPPAPPMLRALAGASLFYVAPRGDFAQNVARGFGYSVAGSVAGDTAGILALRAEWQDVTYGVSSSNDTTTRNVIRSLDLGPQIMLPLGGVRPYASVSLGAAYTGTSGSAPCYRNCSYDEDGNREDDGFTLLPHLTYSVGRAVGVLFRTAKATATRPALWMDVRLSFRHNGETRYGLHGGASEVARGETDYRMLHVGLSTGMR